MNTIIKEGYSQVCVWEGCVVGVDNIQKFEDTMANKGDMFINGVRVQYLEEIQTNPSQDNDGNNISNTGGRNDLLFAVHNEDVPTFALQRLPYDIRWIEDVLSPINNTALYPERLQQYCNW